MISAGASSQPIFDTCRWASAYLRLHDLELLGTPALMRQLQLDDLTAKFPPRIQVPYDGFPFSSITRISIHGIVGASFLQRNTN